MKQAVISCEQIDRLMNIKKQQVYVQRDIEYIRKTGNGSIKELSKLIDRSNELQEQLELLIRGM